ncbi:MAG: hypothetical protein C5S45_06740 [Candidatus Methanocomedens sp.]|nr:MAG: hypothetical protein C5S45_06740 [ANME-2 cluster archaeon]
MVVKSVSILILHFAILFETLFNIVWITSFFRNISWNMESHDLASWTGFTGFTGWNGNHYPVDPVNPVTIFDFSDDPGKLLPPQCWRDPFLKWIQSFIEYT